MLFEAENARFFYIRDINAGFFIRKREETKGAGPLRSCEPGLPVSGLQLPSISFLIFNVVTSCGEPVPYSYIIQKPGLEYIFFLGGSSIWLVLWTASGLAD